jgi:hypothetical protein
LYQDYETNWDCPVPFYLVAWVDLIGSLQFLNPYFKWELTMIRTIAIRK